MDQRNPATKRGWDGRKLGECMVSEEVQNEVMKCRRGKRCVSAVALLVFVRPQQTIQKMGETESVGRQLMRKSVFVFIESLIGLASLSFPLMLLSRSGPSLLSSLLAPRRRPSDLSCLTMAGRLTGWRTHRDSGSSIASCRPCRMILSQLFYRGCAKEDTGIKSKCSVGISQHSHWRADASP